MAYILIFITAIFVNNIVLSQFLGICPFLGVSKKVDTALGMGAAVAFVLTLATIVTYLIQIYVLNAFGLEYLQTIAFILVIAALVQMVEIVLKKVSPSLYQALGVFLPLITTNCCILGVAILVAQGTYNTQGLEANLLTGVVYAIATALGFALALVIFAGIREHLSLMNIPRGMQGMAIALVTAGLLAMAFMGFSGVDAGLAKAMGLKHIRDVSCWRLYYKI
jgi:electron transport complex protein RnfA